MKTKWNLLIVLALLATLVGATASPARAQETHYFTWTPASPQEGGSATITVNYPGTYSVLILMRSTTPGATTCDYTLAVAWYPDTISVSTEFYASGNYLFCLDIIVEQGGTHIYDNQWVSVTNMPPLVVIEPSGIQPEPSQAGEEIVYPTAYGYDYDPVETWNDFTCTVDYGDGTGVQPAVWEYPINQYNDCVGPNHVYATAGTYTITFRIYEPGVAEPGIVTYNHVVEPAPPPSPYIYDITITSKAGRNNTSAYTGLVTILGEYGPLNKASVTADWWQIFPDGTSTLMATQRATTNRSGIAKFTLSRAPTGVYDLCVTNVVAKGLTWPPDEMVCYSYIHTP
jgi:hypothetical protein